MVSDANTGPQSINTKATKKHEGRRADRDIEMKPPWVPGVRHASVASWRDEHARMSGLTNETSELVAAHLRALASPASAAEGRGRLRRPATPARHPFMVFIPFTTFM